MGTPTPAQGTPGAPGTEVPRTEAAIVVHTLRSLLVGHRLIPILIVTVPLLVAQHFLSRPRGALLLGLVMCVAFVSLAPVSWRVLFPDGAQGHGNPVRMLLYGAVGAGAVLTIGFAIPKLLDMDVTLMTERAALSLCLALFLVGGWGLGRDIGFEESLARERARAEALAREADRAQLLALRAHLDPHFLFNTLNCIAEWCREDGEVAEKAVLQLSSLLRSVLAGVRSQSWPLDREMELVDQLMALHLLRNPGRFQARRTLEPGTGAIPVPPLVLLPLAENAVKHGPAAGHAGDIVLHVVREGDGVLITLENPGPYRGPRPGSDGLPMVLRRLDLAYGSLAHLDIRGVGERTRVELRLPAAGPVGGVSA